MAAVQGFIVNQVREEPSSPTRRAARVLRQQQTSIRGLVQSSREEPSSPTRRAADTLL